MIIHVADRLPGNDDILPRLQPLLVLMEEDPYAPLDLIALYSVAKSFGHTDAEPHMIGFRMVGQIYDELPVCIRPALFEDELEITFFFNSESLFHH